MKRTIAITLALAFAAALPAAATPEDRVGHTVYNTTDKCVWFSAYSAAWSHLAPFWINDSANYVKPGASYYFTVRARPHLKVRAQPYRTGCSGDRIADVDNVTNNGIDAIKHKMDYKIVESNGQWSVQYSTP